MKQTTVEEIADFAFHATLLPVLEAAIRTHILEAIRTPSTLAEVLQATGLANAPAVERLLRVLCAAGLARPEGGERFAATDATLACLLPTSALDLGSYVLAMAEISRAMLDDYAAQLPRTDPAPLLPAWDSARGRPTAQRHSAAMAAATGEEVLREVTQALLRRRDPSAVRRILDLGGGIGAYAVALAQAFFQAEVMLFDRPVVLELAGGFLSGKRGADRIRQVPGDLVATPFPDQMDVVFASHSLYCELPSLHATLAKIERCLRPGGLLAIRYLARRPVEKDHPLSVLLGDTLTHALYGYGQVHDREMFEAACARVGLIVVGFDDLPSSQMTIATKPLAR